MQSREPENRAWLRENLGRDPLDAPAVRAPRPQRLARSNPPLYARTTAAITGHRTWEIRRAASRSRDRAAILALPALLSRRSPKHFKREPATAVEAADMPDVVDLLKRFDRVGLMTRGTAGYAPGTCGDLHMAVKQWWRMRDKAVQCMSNQNGISCLAIENTSDTNFREALPGSQLMGRLLLAAPQT